MKKTIITIIICGIVFTSIGVFAGSYRAKDILFEPSDTTWKVSNVEEAISDLKTMKSMEFKNPIVESYRGDRKTVELTKTVNKGKYLVVGNSVLGSTNSTSFNEEGPNSTATLTCNKECDIKIINSHWQHNTASSSTCGGYGFYSLELALYQLDVKEDETTIIYNFSETSAPRYAQGNVLEVVQLN